MWVKFSWEGVIKTVEKGFNDDLSPEGKLDILHLSNEFKHLMIPAGINASETKKIDSLLQ